METGGLMYLSDVASRFSCLPFCGCVLLPALAALAEPQTADSCAGCATRNAATPSNPPSAIACVSRGPKNANINVVVFSDFESFLCARFEKVFAALLGERSTVRLICKHDQALSTPHAVLAHEAAVAAATQGKFWEMHDILFANQTKLSRDDLLNYAKVLHLDLAAFQYALDNHVYRPIVEQDSAEARALAVTGTPTFFTNGPRLVDPQGRAALQAVIDSVLGGVDPDKRAPTDLVAAGPTPSIPN